MQCVQCTNKFSSLLTSGGIVVWFCAACLIDLGFGFWGWFMWFLWFSQEDMYAQDSIDLLKDAGIDFERHEHEGIDVQ